MERCLCIHGHFYQPPRENPGLEAIEVQDSAYPYHDWNQRITAECYEPNSVSRILDGEGRIVQIGNNYAKISFNFGPTLLSWLEAQAPEVYQALLEADRESEKAFSGHGSALAQAYNHLILPLAPRRDKYTQVLWGVRDFEHRFGRRPEGMWLPEMAVDLETLDTMAELGIKFTLLTPHQARWVRPIGGGEGWDVSGGRIDPTLPYLIRLPGGRSMALFFHHEAISRGVAFEGLLASGEDFAQRLLKAFSPTPTHPQLVHIATDGETYGHHHRFGDMALSYALHYLQSHHLARLTNYGEFLAQHPPTHEVEIIENTSWSCSHGVERWRSDCGCRPAGHPGWHQAWRAPLREALDWLRDTLIPLYEEEATRLLRDPWAARNDYIEVILDRSPQSLQRFLAGHACRPLSSAQVVTALQLLELQRHAMLMFTSDGWFFDDLSGIETLQVLRHAGRALHLAQQHFGPPLEIPFIKLLERAKSNRPEYGDGRRLYERFVRASRVGLPQVVAHYAVNSLFQEYGPQAKIYCYSIDREDYHSYEGSGARLAVGRAKVTSQLTLESAVMSFGALHLGHHNINAGVREFQGPEAYSRMAQEVSQAFSQADFPQVIRLLDRHFGTSIYSLKSLFRDEQRQVLARILESTLMEVEREYHHIYQRLHPLMRFLTGLGHPFPKAFHSAAEFILNTDLRRALGDELDPGRVQRLLEEARLWGAELDAEGLSYEFTQTLNRIMARFVSAPEDLPQLQKVAGAVALAHSMPFRVELWKAQNLYHRAIRTHYYRLQERARAGDEAAREWVKGFTSLAEQLSIRLTPPGP